MNNEQLERLKTDVKFLGFGDTSTVLYTELEQQTAKGLVAFDLCTEGFFDDDTRMEARLYFELTKDLTRYIFKRYEATLYYPNQPEKTRKQTIYLYRGKGFTFKETFNLLEGRAVNKDRVDLDGVEYNAWHQLNFDEKDQYGNYRIREFRKEWHYDLEAALHAYPISELKNETLKENLIRSLRRGNIHPVKLLKGRKLETIFIEACPSSRLLIFRSQATRAAFDYDQEAETKTPATILPDTATEIDEPAEEELQPTEEQGQPPASRSSHRKRIYK